MIDIIQLLPDHVANQIAAGEVVQRPASVVKELMENAIDAEATTITVIIKDAGKTLIQVTDNGAGMSTTDARLCFERHATSKIKKAEDLFNLHTKGFRGEALASIAAIAHVELKTRQEETDLGTHITIEGSKVTSQEPAVLPKGTTISVKNLFFNIPARRNFLKSDAVEMRHIIDEFHRVALAHPDISFILMHNGNDVFTLPSTNLRQRIVHIFGRRTDEKLVPVSEETPILKINGFVLKPEYGKKSRGEQFFFVNNRFIRNSYLHHAVCAAFEGLIKTDVHPGYFIYLEVNPESIDINIHPTKTEIKFDDEHSIYAMLRASIKHSLGQFNIAPVLDFQRQNELDTPYEYSRKQSLSIPTIEVDRDFNPFKEDKGGGHFSGSSFKKVPSATWEALYTQQNFERQEQRVEFEVPSKVGLFEQQPVEVNHRSFQFQNKYILTPIKTGLMIIHQNFAHQRILYEEFLKNITVKEAISQQLLFPLDLHFSRPDIRIIQKVKEQLEQIGFVFANMEADMVSIAGIPVMVIESQVSTLLEHMIHAISEEIPDDNFALNDRLAKSLSESMAVKSGVTLNEEEREDLINRLFACKEPTVSPANKPTFRVLEPEEFDKKFM
ncbi:MAG TPA: DNA mismatch repair endonuclease MutL [Flavobacteriaceae bacterium]|nr:DNA mismatch repair endonuclease MutL [Flavobacteriaceae bacterium]